MFLDYILQWTTRPRYTGSLQREIADPLCELNTVQEPAGSTPLHQIFEEFASSQNAFMEAFVPALEKMLANGYSR